MGDDGPISQHGGRRKPPGWKDRRHLSCRKKPTVLVRIQSGSHTENQQMGRHFAFQVGNPTSLTRTVNVACVTEMILL